MVEFLVELYISQADSEAVARGANKARQAAEELTRQGTRVHYLQSIFVPEDETCFVLFEAISADAVQEAARRAALSFERVSEAVSSSRRGRMNEHGLDAGDAKSRRDDHDGDNVKSLTKWDGPAALTRRVQQGQLRSAARKERL